jgi:putative nucleotidyltransferase with HDIG domain
LNIPIALITQDPQTQRWLGLMRKHELGLFEHSLHVAKLVTDYTRFCGLAFETAWPMIEGGLLHDIGKTQLPASLLVKPKGLNDSEQRMMILHPGFGAALLDAQGYYAAEVIAIVKSHHERLDGSGYPEGLRKSRTAKAVCIVAVCDAFCAMTESRPYENAWPAEIALARLRSMSAQYDGEAVASLGEMLEARQQGWQSADTYIDEPVNVVTKVRRMGLLHPRSAFYKAVYPPDGR